MEILNLIQGSDEWLEARLKYLCASEAPAMMGCSKFMSRNQLLALKKGWLSNPVGDFKQQLYDKGHEGEESAREHVELDICEEIPAAVGLVVIEGLELLSSFDGLGETRYIWEHKLWNEVLSENVLNGVLEPMYYWQLEHQMLTAGVKVCHFSTSNGGTDKREQMIYQSIPERRSELIAGWKQFNTDLDAYVIEAKQEMAVAQKVEGLPVVEYRLEGSLIVSNIKDCLPIIQGRAQAEMVRVLETEQDFADKDQLNKATKNARAKLKGVVASVQSEFVSYSEFAETAAEIDAVLQKMQSAGENQVKEQKELKKQRIIDNGIADLNNHIAECNEKLGPRFGIQQIVTTQPDFPAVMKGKRTIDSWQNAVDSELNQVKLEINQAMERVVPSLEYLRQEAGDYKFLFNDVQQLVNQAAESFQAIVKQRIADHKQAEEERLAAEREKIRIEEEAKAKAKIENEQRIQREADEKIQRDADRAEADRIAGLTKENVENPAQTTTATEPAAEKVIPKPVAKTFAVPVDSKNKSKSIIIGAIDDLVASFLFYDRKEDEDLPNGSIESAIESGLITTEEIVSRFEKKLKAGL